MSKMKTHPLPILGWLSEQKARPKTLADLVKTKMAEKRPVGKGPLARLVKRKLDTRQVTYKGQVLKLKRAPFGATSWADVDAYADAEQLQELMADLRTLIDGVLADSSIADKGAAITALVNEYQARLEGVTNGTS